MPFRKFATLSLAGSLIVLATLIAVGAINPSASPESRPLLAIATPAPTATPDTSVVPVTRDTVLIQCVKPDDCGLSLFTVPQGSRVKILSRSSGQTAYVRVLEVNRTSTCDDAEHEQKYAVRPTAALCVLRGIEGVMPLN